jgi:glycosyltransferase involved in cell wall biosynthesis
MRIAYFSPLPPQKTGIATYSAHLLTALREMADIEVLDATVAADALVSPDGHDARLYHLGNNPWFHLDIYRTLVRHPGVVVLHDTVLYYLIAGLGVGGLVKEFCLNLGPDRLGELEALLAACPQRDILQYPHPERYPLLRRVLEQARAIIVHSRTAEHTVRTAGYGGLVEVVSQPWHAEPDADVDPRQSQGRRAELGVAPHEILIGSFGFVGPTKRLIPLLRAVARIKERCPVKVLIVGEGDERPIEQEIGRLRLGGAVRRLGFVTDQEFTRHLSLADIVANLRYPSMGESSATLIQAFGLAKPCIVTDDAWFGELPNATVCKVRHGPREVDELTEALATLVCDPALRHRLGHHAKAYVERHCAVQDIARRYLDVVARVAGADGPAGAERAHHMERDARSALASSADEREWVRRYLLARTLQVMPVLDG